MPFLDGFLVDPNQFLVTQWLVLRGLGLIYLIAFASFTVQAIGLIGEQGILPARAYLDAVKRTLGRKGYWFYLTLAWLDAGDRSLQVFCWSGIILSLLLLFGVGTTPVLVLLWILYRSLVTIGQVFLGFQWDVLLLETGFLSIFLAPLSLWPDQAAGLASPLVIWLFRWLIFRLMFMSGVRKWVSGDPTWRNVTALAYHYETQPLPNPLAWFLYRAPLWFHKFSTLLTHIVELPVPFLFFAPTPLRYAAGLLTILLQLLILSTGNYAFFNLLTILLTFFLFDDRLFRLFLPRPLLNLIPNPSVGSGLAWSNWILIPLALFVVITGLVLIASLFLKGRRLPRPAELLLLVAQVTGIVNGYGLFSVMTTKRPEIIVEGSDDGEHWLPYAFKYKPGDPKRMPPIVAPHQPRLDWQMWFAALGTYSENPWFVQFVVRLLIGSPPVGKLLAASPFGEKPPKYIRASLYDYHFSTPAERAKTGAWWTRELLGPYLPAVSVKETAASEER